MSYFRFTDTNHVLTLREREDLRRSVLEGVHGRHESATVAWAPLLAVCARLCASPAFVGALSVVVVVGVGSGLYLRATNSATSSTLGAIDDATTLAVQNLEAPRSTARVDARDMRVQEAAQQAESAMMTMSSVATDDISPQVAASLAVLDEVLTSTSNMKEMPIARIVASLARLQSAAETNIENGVGNVTDDTVLSFIEERKPLLTLLTASASLEEKLAIHTAAAEDVLADVRKTSDAGSIFAETWLATHDTQSTTDFLDDLSTAQAVARATVEHQ